MITGAVVLLVIAAAGAAAAVLSHGSQAAGALGSRAAATPATGPDRSAAASGAGRPGYGLASPAGWRHGFPGGWGGRGWVWGPYRGGPHAGGPWW